MNTEQEWELIKHVPMKTLFKGFVKNRKSLEFLEADRTRHDFLEDEALLDLLKVERAFFRERVLARKSFWIDMAPFIMKRKFDSDRYLPSLKPNVPPIDMGWATVTSTPIDPWDEVLRLVYMGLPEVSCVLKMVVEMPDQGIQLRGRVRYENGEYVCIPTSSVISELK